MNPPPCPSILGVEVLALAHFELLFVLVIVVTLSLHILVALVSKRLMRREYLIPYLWLFYEVDTAVTFGFLTDDSKYVALPGLFVHESYLACKNKIAAADTSSSNSTIFWALWSALHLTLNC